MKALFLAPAAGTGAVVLLAGAVPPLQDAASAGPRGSSGTATRRHAPAPARPGRKKPAPAPRKQGGVPGGHTASVHSVAFRGDGRLLASRSEQRTLRSHVERSGPSEGRDGLETARYIGC